MQARLDDNPDAMRLRRSSVEHPYGTIKSWMGATHFLTKGLECVKAEMSLHVLAYNFRRLLKLLGMKTMLSAIRAYACFFESTEAFERNLLPRFVKPIEQRKRPATRPSHAPQLTVAGHARHST
jgi:hypothetical protein